ncbi:PE domain-containing protein [Saccharothrix luteola]|uniref:PE domain-containing protein n=1 Tax=Saccharothrix luteola TaxID=2893018 RepID=UPI001E64429D|nr:PE domain-containing protein [Saccharothrix luteola]MCC8244985.1 PE domain-containing protein [Saccharothrix luteola]
MTAVKVDLDAVRQAITAYAAIVINLASIHGDGEAMTQVEAPGQDVPSQLYVQAATQRGASCQQANVLLRDALQERIDKLNSVVEKYNGTEQSNSDSFTK